MSDKFISDVEKVREIVLNSVNSDMTDSREKVEALYGKGNVFNTKELQDNFEVLGFMAPFVIVKRLADGVKGSLMFRHSPRFYFDFKEDK
jgi:hypothetical protein